VLILKHYIKNFNISSGESIVGTSEYIKEEVYRQMTQAYDFAAFNSIGDTFTCVINGDIGMVRGGLLLAHYFLGNTGILFSTVQSGGFAEMVASFAVTSTVCTIFCLPDEQNETLKDKALRYKLVRSDPTNPFLGINACPLLGV